VPIPLSDSKHVLEDADPGERGADLAVGAESASIGDGIPAPTRGQDA